ncbi:hypothetical protein [Sphingomonas montanisoli]|uniref:Uncharacterized protein n=1 Tax=Sphingomonas montanisoli TaxID=2606412 RepID=A0A5D9BWW6_9SPHN|nr:hypothetical protein [Sphingomonas montanisoli]TZG23884.1 hypothetical protein FYJ91_20480 [Sphingomonas montanisoli]
MAYGLRIWDAAGNLELDISTNAGRIVATIETGATSGSQDVPGFATGAPFWTIMPLGGLAYGNLILPSVSRTGTTLTWTYASGTGPVNCIIICGVR